MKSPEAAPGLSWLHARLFADALGQAPPAGGPLARAAAFPGWLSIEMIATRAARRRLRAWAAHGRPEPTADDVVRGLCFVGDVEARQVVLTALLYHAPAPVCWYLLPRAIFSAVGWSTRGQMWRCSIPRRDMVVVLDGSCRNARELLGLCLHEVAHAFLVPRPRQMQTAALLGYSYESTLLRAASQPSVMSRLTRTMRRQEQQADALAARWGGTLTGSDEAGLAYAAKEGARLAERYGNRP